MVDAFHLLKASLIFTEEQARKWEEKWLYIFWKIGWNSNPKSGFNSEIYTLDNRKLKVFQDASIKIKMINATEEEIKKLGSLLLKQMEKLLG